MTFSSREYDRVRDLALSGRTSSAVQEYRALLEQSDDRELHARILNDLGVLAALDADHSAALSWLSRAAAVDGTLQTVEQNRGFLNARAACPSGPSSDAVRGGRSVRIAVLSFLFNWPSTGGGIIHTVELVRFLSRAGYAVQLFYPRFPDWGIGGVSSDCPVDGVAVEFDSVAWHAAEIRKRFRAAVGRFHPDCVLITDCWNFKPHLADAMRGYPYLLRMQAQELLCPLNNLRLLPGTSGQPEQCRVDQLAAPGRCFNCLLQHGQTSGGLHQADRRLSAVGTAEYGQLLRRSLREAAAVLTLNPEVAQRFRPWASRVEVVTWGMDPARFPWPRNRPALPNLVPHPGVTRILFAGLTDEPIKGFHTLHSACEMLRRHRKDFELVVTRDPPGRIDEFTISVGWKSQAELPDVYAACDICTVPTIAQDGLSRTSVEAMATGLPVVGSRLGGLPWSITDGVTGMLCTAGDPETWARALERLIDDPGLRSAMGQAGRRVFEERFTWERVIDTQYRPLLSALLSTPAETQT